MYTNQRRLFASICASIAILVIASLASRLGLTEITLTGAAIALTLLALGIMLMGFRPYMYRFHRIKEKSQSGKAEQLDEVDQALIILGGVVVVFVIANVLAYFLMPPVHF